MRPPIPPRLLTLLSESSALDGPVLTFADAVGTILTDNATPFFPAYTDHGVQHVASVLTAADRLIPDEVFHRPILQPEDAAVLICAALLHDLAMHVHELGFAALVDPSSQYMPARWFSRHHPGRPCDEPWPRLWEAFQREARHFGTSQLDLLLGPDNDGVPQVAFERAPSPAEWTLPDRLLVGEFLRRHHARLSHEIALAGFPGAGTDFPVLAEALGDLADATGAVARSHGEPLRLMLDYLEWEYRGNRRPAGALLAYLMGVLRIADYLQLEATRAPPLLMRLKAPQSRQSIEEWNKQGAVSKISWEHRDPQAIHVEVSPHHGLRTHLALRELFADVERELDTTTAVLSEAYETPELAPLRLSRQRLCTNLDEPSMHEQLPYLPRRAALRSDADLFRLVIRELYGNRPAVAGRELIQNAVDAVRARRAWEDRTGAPLPPGAMRALQADVEVTLAELDGGRCVLRVADRGIGMTPEVVVDYFLQAGASFGPTRAQVAELGRREALRAMRAGRFGVGAFAAFLLGREMRVQTRHAEAERGLSFRAHLDEDVVEIRRVELPVGTEVEIPFDAGALPTPPPVKLLGDPSVPRALLREIASFYRLMDPVVAFRHVTDDGVTTVTSHGDVPGPERRLPDHWRRVAKAGYDGILWQLPRRGERISDTMLVHNGIRIGEPDQPVVIPYTWASAAIRRLLDEPDVAVFDSRHLLGLTLPRYALTETTLPFERELLASIGMDVVAHALVVGPRAHPLGKGGRLEPVFGSDDWLPMLPALLRRHLAGPLLIQWVDQLAGYPDPSGPTSRLDPRARRNAIAWRTFPHRVLLFADTTDTSVIAFLDAETELREWRITLTQVQASVRQWRELLGARRTATVVARPGELATRGGPPAGGAPSTYQNGGAWRHLHAGVADGGRGLFLLGVRPQDAELERQLLEAAAAVERVHPQPFIAMTAFADLREPDGEDDPLARAWLKMVGGELARQPAEREVAATEILARHPRLRPLVEAWQRLRADGEG